MGEAKINSAYRHLIDRSHRMSSDLVVVKHWTSVLFKRLLGGVVSTEWWRLRVEVRCCRVRGCELK